METFVVLAYDKGDVNKFTHLVAVCDSLFIAKRYADTEAKASRGTMGCVVLTKLMNAPFTEMDRNVYKTK
jgi:hypothetical protein